MRYDTSERLARIGSVHRDDVATSSRGLGGPAPATRQHPGSTGQPRRSPTAERSTVSHTKSVCAFCAISSGAVVTPVVYETREVVAFFPQHPATIGHTLVIPRAHIEDLWALDKTTAQSLAAAVLRVAHAIRDTLQPGGLNVINSAGAAASQTVFHVHVHLVPRWHGDEFGDIWPDPTPSYSPSKISAAATSIRAALT